MNNEKLNDKNDNESVEWVKSLSSQEFDDMFNQDSIFDNDNNEFDLNITQMVGDKNTDEGRENTVLNRVGENSSKMDDKCINTDLSLPANAKVEFKIIFS